MCGGGGIVRSTVIRYYPLHAREWHEDGHVGGTRAPQGAVEVMVMMFYHCCAGEFANNLADRHDVSG